MSTLTAWRFGDPSGAFAAEERLRELQRDGLVLIEDAAIISWPHDAAKPVSHNLTHLSVGEGALGGAFWGFLFGLLFLAPLIGAAVGEAIGALVGSLSDAGIDKEFIAGVRYSITPGTSALFLVTSSAVRDRLAEELAGLHPLLIATNLTPEQEETLRTAFT
jgi:uncharacterized membrane protein